MRLEHETLSLNASTKRQHETQAQNATSNGGDASRVGHFSAASGRVAPIRDWDCIMGASLPMGTLRTNCEVSMQCSQNPSNPSSPWCWSTLHERKIRAIGVIREL